MRISNIKIGDIMFSDKQDVTVIFKNFKVYNGLISLYNDYYVLHSNERDFYRYNDYGEKYNGYEYAANMVYIKNGNFNNDFVILNHCNIEIVDRNICPKLLEFLYNRCGYNVMSLLGLKLNVIDNFNTIESSTDGFIELKSSNNKIIKIKLVRLLRKLILKYNKLETGNILSYKDSYLEDINNAWTSLTNSSVTYEILNGENILNGYKSQSYIKGGSTLQKSCMTDKLDYLKLYTENKNVSLIVFYLEDKICGRCFLWKCDDGNQYYDKLYYGLDWLKSHIIDILNPMFNQLNSDNSVTLDNIEFEYYPYIDSFFYVCKPLNKIYYIIDTSYCGKFKDVKFTHYCREQTGIIRTLS